MSKRSQPDDTPAKVGRPLADIDEAEVAKLAFEGLTNSGIATLLDTSPDLIKRRFGKLCTKKRIERKRFIRQTQWDLLTCDDKKVRTTMAIWLGKNELGQTDKASAEITQRVERVKIIELPPEGGDDD